MKDGIYYNDYDTEPIGGGNPYYRCVHCKVSDPEINGRLEGHREWCEYRIKKEYEINIYCLFDGFISLIENWDGHASFLKEDERYINLKNRIKKLIYNRR